MVFAIMYYQFGVRNGDNGDRKAQLNELSNKHYHWCLDKVWDIATEGSIATMQAVTMIAIHCRGFPKPGPAYLMATLAWNRAIEMNLHRAYLKRDEPTNLENELRKRVWWSLFMVFVMLCGRLGKPMPIRAEDIDVDYPEAIADEYLTEEGILEHDDTGDCYWLVASSGFRLSFLFMDMWNNVYSTRQDARRYVESIRRVEQRFRAFQRELPDELRPDKCKPANRVVATYLQGSSYEFLFCLRHPSRCATGDPAFVAENYRASDDAAKNMLRVASELARLKSLDTTWYQMAVYVAVIFTLLASKWERRAEITSAELTELRENVSLGMSVIGEILKYIGTSRSRRKTPLLCVPRTHLNHRDRRVANTGPDNGHHRKDNDEHRARHDLATKQPHVDTVGLPPAATTAPEPVLQQARRLRRTEPTGSPGPEVSLRHADPHNQWRR